MTYTYTTDYGGGIILAPCLATLCGEIAAHPDYRNLTNLGEIGDTPHQGQGQGSDHNPFVVHNGRGYIRAIDLGGDRGLLLELRAKLFAIYHRHDPRMYPYGYLKGPDSLISDWPPGTGWHVDTGDEGHLHISVNQNGGLWVPALDSRAPWLTTGPTPLTLEAIMALDRKSADYKNLCEDIAAAVGRTSIAYDPDNPKKTMRRDTLLLSIYNRAKDTLVAVNTHAAAPAAKK